MGYGIELAPRQCATASHIGAGQSIHQTSQLNLSHVTYVVLLP